MAIFLFFFFVLLGLALGAYWWYVVIISRRNKALEALAGVDVQLKMRSELIPNILAIAKRFMEHELNLMNKITELRAKAATPYDPKLNSAVQEHLSTVTALDAQLKQLMVQVEAYPDLKSSAPMLEAQQAYSNIEEQIAAARRFYNAGVNSLNNSVQIFPGTFIASIIKVNPMPFYEAEASAKQPVNAEKYL